MVCYAGPGQACGGHQPVDLLVPAGISDFARIDYTAAPGSTKPLGPPLPADPGLCWDCRCPMEVPVKRPGTDRDVCRDCQDLYSSPWGCPHA